MVLTKSSKVMHTARDERDVGAAQPPGTTQTTHQSLALFRAAQRLIAEGKLNVPVLEITQAADVGMGSFYNHFDSKEELFAAAGRRCARRLRRNA